MHNYLAKGPPRLQVLYRRRHSMHAIEGALVDDDLEVALLVEACEARQVGFVAAGIGGQEEP